MSSVQEVHAAIQALYGQNAAQQKQANEFLVRFAATPQAWEVSLQLVAVNDSAVCYFGANMLHGVRLGLQLFGAHRLHVGRENGATLPCVMARRRKVL